QRDPVVEYQREGFDMFSGMLEGLKEETLQFLYNVQVQTEQAAPAAAPAPAPAVAPALAGAGNGAAPAPVGGEQEAPAALRAVGVEQPEVPMTYSGPSEGGGT
ncbi:preprotein translocase subunit SecA, partial [Streptomyces sp. SID10244]|nr:preprotein translocase subunit SecA [Streptomyces sp. SID10244]